MSKEFDEKKLDSPLVVHKITDASYQDTDNEIEFAHNENEDTATLERHRYRKVKKAKKWPYVLIACIVAVVVIITTLYFCGVIPVKREEETNPGNTKNYVQEESNEFEGVITVKNSYVFFEGQEVDGVQGLVKEIKYLDAGTKFIVQNEEADGLLFNEEIIPTLESYGIEYEIQIVVSSGLVSRYEKTESTSGESASVQSE